MAFFLVVICVLQLALCILYHLGWVDILFTVLTAVCSVGLMEQRLSLRRSLMFVIVLTYMVCAFSIVALFKYVPVYFTLSSTSIVDEDFAVLASYSTKVVFLVMLTYLIFNRLITSKNSKTKFEIYTRPTNGKIWSFLIVFFILSYISMVVGIGQMGQETTKLPFHLAGIIQFLRVNVAQYIALILYVSLKKDSLFGNKNAKTQIKRFLIAYFFWTLFETYVRMSKSSIANAFMPIILYEVYIAALQHKLKKFFVSLLPFFLVLLLVYSVVENSRDAEGITLEVNKENNATYMNPKANDPLVRPYSRFFINGFHFLTCYREIDQNALFDFSKMPVILAMGGSARYKTFVIDGYPDGVHHSSGNTYLIDALLCGGYGLSYIFLIILVIAAIKTDAIIRGPEPIETGILCAITVFNYTKAGLSVSMVVDPMSINYWIVFIALLVSFNMMKRVSKTAT